MAARSGTKSSSGRKRTDTRTDAIKLLKQDHQEVRDLFRRFDAAGDRAHKSKAKIVGQLIEELSRHSAIEEQIFYPAARNVMKDEDVVLESLEEHHIVKWTLSELDGMDPQDERFDAKVTVLKELVLHHAKEEEQDMFPKIRKALSPADLRDLGEQMERAKKAAPTHPHPRSPDEPPGNIVAGAAAAIVDRGRDVVRDVLKRRPEDKTA
ncbi:MAG: hemerythrin domain-containing protein [Actinomycetota bacterium]